MGKLSDRLADIERRLDTLECALAVPTKDMEVFYTVDPAKELKDEEDRLKELGIQYHKASVSALRARQDVAGHEVVPGPVSDGDSVQRTVLKKHYTEKK